MNIVLNYVLQSAEFFNLNRNYERKLTLCPPQNLKNHYQHFGLLFFMINLHFGASNHSHKKQIV